MGIFSYFNTDVWLGSFPTKSSRSYNPPFLEWLILCQMWWHGLNFYPKIKFGTEFFSTRFDLDKEFSHVFRAAVYFEPPEGFLAHFDCINWVLSWNAQFCSHLLTSNIVFQVQKNFFKLTGLICFRKKSCFYTVPKILYFINWNFNHKLSLGLCTLRDYL